MVHAMNLADGRGRVPHPPLCRSEPLLANGFRPQGRPPAGARDLHAAAVLATDLEQGVGDLAE